jgi:hypothetical protein
MRRLSRNGAGLPAAPCFSVLSPRDGAPGVGLSRPLGDPGPCPRATVLFMRVAGSDPHADYHELERRNRALHDSLIHGRLVASFAPLSLPQVGGRPAACQRENTSAVRMVLYGHQSVSLARGPRYSVARCLMNLQVQVQDLT